MLTFAYFRLTFVSSSIEYSSWKVSRQYILNILPETNFAADSVFVPEAVDEGQNKKRGGT